jgi:hypothetical protein
MATFRALKCNGDDQSNKGNVLKQRTGISGRISRRAEHVQVFNRDPPTPVILLDSFEVRNGAPLIASPTDQCVFELHECQHRVRGKSDR